MVIRRRQSSRNAMWGSAMMMDDQQLVVARPPMDWSVVKRIFREVRSFFRPFLDLIRPDSSQSFTIRSHSLVESLCRSPGGDGHVRVAIPLFRYGMVPLFVPYYHIPPYNTLFSSGGIERDLVTSDLRTSSLMIYLLYACL
eukprot:scaffold2737_cov156-Amphora_coffeaeformis.AAC.3